MKVLVKASRVATHTVDSLVTTYGYDDIGQLTSESRTGYSAGYTYDANGNRLTRTVNSVTEDYAYDDADKLQDVKISSVTQKSYGYDAAGRTTSVVTGAGTTTLAYDYEGRISQITYPSTATNTFTYNGLDTRVSKVDSAGTSTYKRDGAGVTAPVLNDGSATYTPGISERRSSTTTFLHSGLKNADSQSGTGQTIAATKQYDAFGNVLSSTGTWKGPFGYAGSFGYQEDADSSLKLLGHRYYDASIGRFLTRDPIKDGRNWYGYCENGPIANLDATGTVIASLAALYLADSWLPDMPPGVDLGTIKGNIKLVQAIVADGVNSPPSIPQFPGDLPIPDAGAGYVNAVAVVLPWIHKGGRWDYKQYDPDNLEHYDDLGNFNAGAIGGALGIPKWAMLVAGDADQIRETGTLDEPDDRYWIERGYRFYHEGR